MEYRRKIRSDVWGEGVQEFSPGRPYPRSGDPEPTINGRALRRVPGQGTEGEAMKYALRGRADDFWSMTKTEWVDTGQ
jgi:hypothetical protein